MIKASETMAQNASVFDAILVTTHYNYDEEGYGIPPASGSGFSDLSYVVPLGIIHIAQYLFNCGLNVRVVHLPHEMHTLRRFGMDEASIKDAMPSILSRYPARVCGIQVHWHLYCGGALYISSAYKNLFPESQIILGGYMASALWREFLSASEDIDGIVLGEGEKPFRRIVENVLSSNQSIFADVQGVAFRKGNKELEWRPPSSRDFLSVEEIPVIRPDALPFEGMYWPKGHYVHVARGLCPEKCAYCVANNPSINSRPYQMLCIDRILEQIHAYQENGVEQLFMGETQFLNTSFMEALLESIIGEDFDLYFELETHPVLFESQKLLEKMIQAKFWRFTMGCESGSDSLLRRMNRRSNAAQILSSVIRIAESGGIVLTSWISNLPGETAAEFLETQEILRRVVRAKGFVYWIENLHVSPGSRLHENPELWDIEILPRCLEDWIRWSMVSKRYVSFEEAIKNPLRYLTHVSKGLSPEAMMERFYSNRRLALLLMPEMKTNLLSGFPNLDRRNLDIEMETLNWYEGNGWKLWLF